MRIGDGVTVARSEPLAKCPFAEIWAVTTSPGAVRGTNTTSPLLLPTPSPPAAIESIGTLIVGISCAIPRFAPPASTSPLQHSRKRCYHLSLKIPIPRAPTGHAPRVERPP